MLNVYLTIFRLMRGHFFPIFVSVLCLSSAGMQPAWSRPAVADLQLQRDIADIKQGQESLRKELESIKQLLQARAPGGAAVPPLVQPINAVVNIRDNPVKGDTDAKLTLIEFSDYQCPFCRRHAETTVPEIEKEYVSKGKLRYVFRDFPLEAIHQKAFKAAEAAHCAGEQNQYWAMHDRLFAEQQTLSPEKFVEQAQALGLDMDDFKDCLNAGKQAERIRASIAEGQKLGISGTPTMLLGISDGGRVKDIKILRGAQPFSSIQAEINKLLAAP